MLSLQGQKYTVLIARSAEINGLVQLEGRWKAFTLMSRRFHLGFVWDGVRLGGGGGRGGNGWPECSNYSCFIVSKRF